MIYSVADRFRVIVLSPNPMQEDIEPDELFVGSMALAGLVKAATECLYRSQIHEQSPERLQHEDLWVVKIFDWQSLVQFDKPAAIDVDALREQLLPFLSESRLNALKLILDGLESDRLVNLLMQCVHSRRLKVVVSFDQTKVGSGSLEEFLLLVNELEQERQELLLQLAA